jgi:hypothetical protein
LTIDARVNATSSYLGYTSREANVVANAAWSLNPGIVTLPCLLDEGIPDVVVVIDVLSCHLATLWAAARDAVSRMAWPDEHNRPSPWATGDPKPGE